MESDLVHAVSFCFQMWASGGYDTSLTFHDDRVARQIIFSGAMLTGLTFAVLVGLVNKSVFETMDSLKDITAVASRGHTLILGWNECNVRVVCQIAFVRRAFFLQYETVAASCFPWFRVKPSTPVVASPVVIMCNTKGKKGPIFATSVSRKSVFTLSARLAMGSLSEDSSVSEGNTALPRAYRSLASAIGVQSSGCPLALWLESAAQRSAGIWKSRSARSCLIFLQVQHHCVMFGINPTG